MKSLIALFFLFAVSINLAQAQTTEIDLCLNDVMDITLDLDTLTADSVTWSQVSSGIWSTLPDSSDTTLTTDYNTLFVPSVTTAWDSIQLMADLVNKNSNSLIALSLFGAYFNIPPPLIFICVPLSP